MSRPSRARGLIAVAGVLLACWVGPAIAQSGEGESLDPWAKGRQWLTVRFGYARSSANGAADGNVGFGFAYTRFRDNKWSYSAAAHFDVLGRYGSAAEFEVPWTLEITRHFKWNTPLRTYLGLGAGMYYHKTSGTGADAATVSGAPHIAGGFNAPVSGHSVLGVDVRMSIVSPSDPTNPVFGGEVTTGKSQSKTTHWSAKLGYGWVF